MGNFIHTIDHGLSHSLEHLPCGEITPKAGMFLKMASGKLAIASGSDVPTYLSMTERSEACKDGEIIAVLRVRGDTIFQTDTPQAFTAAPGDKVTISTDGMSITNTAGGACEIVTTDEDVTRFRVGAAEAGASGT